MGRKGREGRAVVPRLLERNEGRNGREGKGKKHNGASLRRKGVKEEVAVKGSEEIVTIHRLGIKGSMKSKSSYDCNHLLHLFNFFLLMMYLFMMLFLDKHQHTTSLNFTTQALQASYIFFSILK